MKIKLTGLSMSGYVDVRPDTPPVFFTTFMSPFNPDTENGNSKVNFYKLRFEFNGEMENDIRIYELVDIEQQRLSII
jgi:hypothetical protein